MHKGNISDELRRLEGEVVEGERQQTTLETEFVARKNNKEDIARLKEALALLCERQQRLQEDRLRLLSRLQP